MIVAENLVKIYKTSQIEVVALQGLDLVVDDGELMAIIGNSGSGKSTLLNMLGALDKPSAGKLFVNGKDLNKMSPKDVVAYKRDVVGFVWQNNARNLIPYMTALENIEVPMLITGASKRRARAKELLEMVRLSHRSRNKLSQLSGGEQQRVAIAIALANKPKLLLADEPTGSVDTATMHTIMEIFRNISRETGITVTIVTHDQQLSNMVDRVVAIRDGRTSSEFLRTKSYAEELAEMGAGGKLSIDGGSSHVELVVVDSAGRLQIPRPYLDELGIKGKSRLRVTMEDGKVIIEAPQENGEHTSK